MTGNVCNGLPPCVVHTCGDGVCGVCVVCVCVPPRVQAKIELKTKAAKAKAAMGGGKGKKKVRAAAVCVAGGWGGGGGDSGGVGCSHGEGPGRIPPRPVRGGGPCGMIRTAAVQARSERAGGYATAVGVGQQRHQLVAVGVARCWPWREPL